MKKNQPTSSCFFNHLKFQYEITQNEMKQQQESEIENCGILLVQPIQIPSSSKIEHESPNKQ